MATAVVNYIELPVIDRDATKTFYSNVLGWQWTDFGDTYSATRSGDVEIALNGLATPGPQHEGGAEDAIGPLVLLATDDLVGVEAAVEAAGGEIVSPPYPYPGGRRFHFADPSGNVLAVYQSAD